MSKLNIFLFVIATFTLWSLSFAIDYKEINSITAPTFKKINKQEYDVSVGGEDMFKIKFLNMISNDNYWIECTGGYVCDLTVELDAKVASKLKEGQIWGSWQEGQAEVEKVFYLKEQLTQYNYTYSNDTVIYYNTTNIIEETDLTKISMDKDEKIEITIRFKRNSLTQVDIYPVLFGKHFKELSIWGVGGTEYDVTINGTEYTVHVFTSNSTFNVTTDIINASVLVVAGGGGGAGNGPSGAHCMGSGGAGGLSFSGSFNISIANYSVVVGVGGSGGGDGSGSPYTQGNNATSGKPSNFSTINTTGGGSGNQNGVGRNGGSGGGGGAWAGSWAGGTGISGQGYTGATGNSAASEHGGGGGGSKAVGGVNSGVGGIGTELDINGSLVSYSTGGSHNITPTNYGDGGGSALSPGGAGIDGYDGVVIIRYPTPFEYTATLNSPVNNSNFTTDTSSIPFNFSCSGNNDSYLANLTIAGVLNASAIPVTNNTNVIQTADFDTNSLYNWSVTCYNGTDTGESSSNEFRIWYAPPNIAVNIQTTNEFINSTQYNYNWTSWAYNTLGASQDINMSLDYSNGTAIATNNSVTIADDGIGIVYGDDELILETNAKNVTLVLTYTNATLAESTGSQNITIVKPGTSGDGLISCISIIGDGCGFTTVNNCAVILQ